MFGNSWIIWGLKRNAWGMLQGYVGMFLDCSMLRNKFQIYFPKWCVFFHGHLPFASNPRKIKSAQKKKWIFTHLHQPFTKKNAFTKKNNKNTQNKNFPPSPVVSGTPQRTHLHQGEQVGLCHQSIWMIFTQDLSKTFTQGRAVLPRIGRIPDPCFLGRLAESNRSKSQKIKLSC